MENLISDYKKSHFDFTVDLYKKYGALEERLKWLEWRCGFGPNPMDEKEQSGKVIHVDFRKVNKV